MGVSSELFCILDSISTVPRAIWEEDDNMQSYSKSLSASRGKVLTNKRQLEEEGQIRGSESVSEVRFCTWKILNYLCSLNKVVPS